MGVSVTNYIIRGVKLDKNFMEDLDEDVFEELLDKHGYDDKKQLNPHFLHDGMGGGYTFFGFIFKFDDESVQEIGIGNYDDETIRKYDTEITEKFKELFPSETIPMIKLYYVPHYT